MAIVSTIPEKCKRCYTCVRECPANAIKVESGQAMVIEERCIVCGNCVKVCAQHAKRIEDGIAAVEQMLVSGKPVFACLAPSFSTAFHPVNPRKILAAVRQLGFAEMPDDLLRMTVDANQIRQMLINLVNNGIDAITDFGKDAGEVMIHVQGDHRHNTVKFEIRDTGCGIPQENLSKLFTPFFTTKKWAKAQDWGWRSLMGWSKCTLVIFRLKARQAKEPPFLFGFR